MDDTLLIKQVQNGNRAAYTQLVEKWHSKIYRFAYRFFADEDEAHDITQKTFIKTYQNVNTLKNPEKFSSWIYRIANNLCLDELKRAGRRKSTSLEAYIEQSGRLEGDQIAPDTDLQNKELGTILQRALLTLPDEQRTVIILKEYEGLKFREIADILEEPESTVKSRLYYGLKSTRRVLTHWNIKHDYLNNG
ncbi:RNA polymerase sigma factor [Rhodohalobacter sp. 8-1]|uniref:RNA polymerase sigma factor n=1 Tax=Rhodohalobacter sp. 8-1 TaxID=3131972 RepID=UPI0030EE5826